MVVADKGLYLELDLSWREEVEEEAAVEHKCIIILQ